MRISGAVKKRARNVDPAALSAGQLSDGTSEKTAEIEKLGKLVKTARKLLSAYSVKRGADGKIVTHRQRLIKRGILKHYADAPLERLHVFFGVRAAYRDAASVLFKQAAHYRYCRAFSRAVYAEKSKKLATPYAEAEIAHRADIAEGFREISNLYDILHHFFLSDRRLFYVCHRSDGEGYHTINIVPCKGKVVNLFFVKFTLRTP